ncbi:hypothetical protein BDV97DRAFT_362340 [Delphinella strobiligena]|nr:hypothetical protein BDV97DRAFT_362340 [Delphinella strobiligena]
MKPLPVETPPAGDVSQPEACNGCELHCPQIEDCTDCVQDCVHHCSQTKDCKRCVHHCPPTKSGAVTPACGCLGVNQSHQTYCFHFILDKTFPVENGR